MSADLHTHILPGVDDGAADLSESLALLEQERESGVDTVVFTPHFRIQQQKPQEFFARREKAFAACAPFVQDTRCLLGAEVLYSEYLANLDSIRDFAIESTDYLLLEMPYQAQFTDRLIASVMRLRDEHGLTPILAHVERYEAVRRNVGILERFREFGCLFQVNAGSVLSKKLPMRAFLRRLVRAGCLDLLASDCHDPKVRPVSLEKAYHLLAEQYSEEFVRAVKGCAASVLSNRRF